MFTSAAIHPENVLLRAKKLAKIPPDADLSRLKESTFEFRLNGDFRIVKGIIDQGGSEGTDGPKIFVKKEDHFEGRRIYYFVFQKGSWLARFDDSLLLFSGSLAVTVH